MHRIRPRQGFTLVEVLVSLAVVSVAATIFFSLFSASLGLAQSNRNQTVAASLAEEQLLAVCQSPAKYNWVLKTAAPGQLVEITAQGDSGQTPKFAPPSIGSASAPDKQVFDQFTWKVFAKLPSSDAAYVEVVVAVYWKEAQHDKVFTLTSAVPRSMVTAAGIVAVMSEEA